MCLACPASANDPGYAPAWALLSHTLFWNSVYRGAEADAPLRRRKTLAAAEKAVELAPSLSSGYTARGLVRSSYDWDWEGARRDFERALALSPGSAQAHVRYGVLLAQLGRLDAALASMRRATELDPLDAGSWNALGSSYIDQGQLALGRRAMERSLAIAPASELAIQNLADVELLEGRPAVALASYQKAALESFRLQGAAIAHHDLGRERESRQALATLEANHGAQQPTMVAEAHAWRGERDEAFRWLDRALAQRDPVLREAKTDRYLRKLHGDERWKALLRRMNLPLD